MPPLRHQHADGQTSRPHVHGQAIARTARGQQVQLGGHERRGAALLLQQPSGRALHGQAEVGELERRSLGRLRNKEVVGLDIPMANVASVQEGDSRQHLAGPEDHLGLSDVRAALFDLVAEIPAFAIFQGHVNVVGVLEGLVEPDDVLVGERGHDMDLAVHIHSPNAPERQRSLVELLHRDGLARLAVHRAPHDTKRALAELHFLQVIGLLD
mmetsp:Transcript_593/g.1203  ORF Transcript_593/g.1203 Transcript_593/m.1203 type:complete len:212 (+) Transcript_593:276-911(+)